MPNLATTTQVLASQGESPSTVRVNNVQTSIQGPKDAWGRPDKRQPLTISVAVHFDKPFATTSASDSLASDTVHYGQLSKAILAALDDLPAGPTTLANVLGHVWAALTGADYISGVAASSTPFLPLANLRYLSLTLCLPKASLSGSGVSLTNTASFTNSLRSTKLSLHGLRAGILLGVNANERNAKQQVVGHVDVDMWESGPDDAYAGLEAVLQKVLDGSSYETIEALVEELMLALAGYLHTECSGLEGRRADSSWQLRVAIEKPIAVPMADAPCVEMRMLTSEVMDMSRDKNS